MTRRHGAGRSALRDDGLSLVEVLVAMGLFGVLGTLLLGLALSTSQVTEDTRSLANVTEQSRLAMERMTRELRQAEEIQAVQFTGGQPTGVTFWTDFNGNGAKDLNAADPEVVTYRWNAGSSELTLTANDASGTATTRPVLAADVTSFVIGLRSSKWQYDSSADGITTTWQELDQSGPPVGNADGVLNGPELAHIDLVSLAMTVSRGSQAQNYSTQVDLRNQD
jgi:prepilin-type N-terminal cleavage/methylation domain-containing protein